MNEAVALGGKSVTRTRQSDFIKVLPHVDEEEDDEDGAVDLPAHAALLGGGEVNVGRADDRRFALGSFLLLVVK